MFDFQFIFDTILSQICFRQNFDGDGVQLTEMTDGAHCVNDAHPMLTFDNIYSVFPDFETKGVTDLNAAYTDEYKKRAFAGLKRLLSDWRAAKMANVSARTLVERERLFRADAGLNHIDPKLENKFVGHELVTSDSMNLAIGVERVGIQLTENQKIRVYLFEAGSRKPAEYVDIDYQGGGAVQWERVNWTVRADQKYFLGYDQSKLTGESINGIHVDDHTQNGTVVNSHLNHVSLANFHSNQVRYLSGIGVMIIENTFIVSEEDTPPANVIWDMEQVRHGYSTNWGLNMEFHVKCDYSYLITAFPDAFGYAWSLRVAIDLMKELVCNPNSAINRNQSNTSISKEILIYEIDGDPSTNGAKTGLLADYKRAMKAIMFDSSSIDKICMPCKKKGIRFKAIG